MNDDDLDPVRRLRPDLALGDDRADPAQFTRRKQQLFSASVDDEPASLLTPDVYPRLA